MHLCQPHFLHLGCGTIFNVSDKMYIILLQYDWQQRKEEVQQEDVCDQQINTLVCIKYSRKSFQREFVMFYSVEYDYWGV